ncbi:hypothetical protein MTsDn1_22850 [Alteromonas sp. MTD1]
MSYAGLQSLRLPQAYMLVFVYSFFLSLLSVRKSGSGSLLSFECSVILKSGSRLSLEFTDLIEY